MKKYILLLIIPFLFFSNSCNNDDNFLIKGIWNSDDVDGPVDLDW